MPLHFVRNDLAKMRADAIVNSANPEPICGSGTEAALYEAAGYKELLAARRKVGALCLGQAEITPAFALNAKFIIHTVGPRWRDGVSGESEQLADCYRNVLMLAGEYKCSSVAVPLISSGINGFPKETAVTVALETIAAFLKTHEMKVTLVVYDKDAVAASGKFCADIQEYISENYIHKKQRHLQQHLSRIADKSSIFLESSNLPLDVDYCSRVLATEIQDLRARIDISVEETFQQRLMELIDQSGMKDPEVYKGANIDRKLFSKIRSNINYKPNKKTALALAIALHLNVEQTEDLLSRAGLALSPASKFDVIIRFFLEKGEYDINEINLTLFEYDQPILG